MSATAENVNAFENQIQKIQDDELKDAVKTVACCASAWAVTAVTTYAVCRGIEKLFSR